MNNQKLTNCTVYFQTSPFLSGHQPNKITDKAGFDIFIIPEFIKFVKGTTVEIVPLANIKSIAFTEDVITEAKSLKVGRYSAS